MLMYLAIGAVFLFYSTFSMANGTTSADLIHMDFEELVKMDIEFSSAGKLTSRVKDLPYPAFVLSSSDIEHSGAQSLPEALRLIPGVFMGQISANEWFLAIRGSGGRFSRYVLIMVDGRIAYNNLFSGVNWDEMNFLMDSIERIEVVRGPNGASWGPNAVNGIIHIITKKQPSSDKSSVAAWLGSEGHRGANAQWHSSIGDNWSLLLNGQQRFQDGLVDQAGQREEAVKDWRTQVSLARQGHNSNTRFMFDAYAAYTSPTYGWVTTSPLGYTSAPLDDEKEGYVFVGEHSATLFHDYKYTLRAAIDTIDSEAILYKWQETNYQGDFELFGDLKNHRLSLGVNWRRSDTNIIYKDILQAEIGMPEQIIDHIGAYISDQISLNKQLSATVSLRWDDHDLAEPAIQPSLRLIWQPNSHTNLWFAHSTAVSTPARTITDTVSTPVYIVESDSLPLPVPVLLRFAAFDKTTKATHVKANEFGWRNTFNKFNIDLSVYQQTYENSMRAELLGRPTPVTDEVGNLLYLDQQILLANNRSYSTHGGELASRIQWSSRWSSQLSFSRLYLLLKNEEGQNTKEWSMSAALQNSLKLSEALCLNVTLRRVNGDFNTPSLFTHIQTRPTRHDSYTIADLNLTWAPSVQWRISAMAKNLGKKHIQAKREQFQAEPYQVAPYGLLKLEYSF